MHWKNGTGRPLSKTLSAMGRKAEIFVNGTSGRTRTVTPVKEPDFESGVSTNFTTLASL